MQPLETEEQLALNNRKILVRLLRWGLPEDEVQVFLDGSLRFHPSPEARLEDWRELVELNETFERIDGGGDPGFYDLGDGQYVTLSHLDALEDAETALEEALDRMVGITATPQRKAA